MGFLSLVFLLSVVPAFFPLSLPSTFKLATEGERERKKRKKKKIEEEDFWKRKFYLEKFISKGISKSRVSPPRLPFVPVPVVPVCRRSPGFFSLFSPAGICRSPSPSPSSLPLLLLACRSPSPSPSPAAAPLVFVFAAAAAAVAPLLLFSPPVFRLRRCSSATANMPSMWVYFFSLLPISPLFSFIRVV